jgi:lactate dehydrogenase-like 2-hydroxyacid dehydrogenase
MKPLVLALLALSDASLDRIREQFEVVHAPKPDQRAQVLKTHGPQVKAVLTNGTIGIPAADMQQLPALSIVCALGAGYENIDVAYAKSRGIVVANGAGTNDDCVADHAVGLLLAVVRGIPMFDQATRQGVWRDKLPMRSNFSRKRLGIIGLGTIGKKIAQRGLGFDLTIGYHNRKPRDDVRHAYFDSLLGLAEWADYLVVATPGGAGTKHLIDTEVLDALGPRGVLVNIARGSVVDTAAVAAALREGRLGGAGLDVYEGEPQPPAALLDLPNVVLTPHVAGSSPEAIQASVERFIENASWHFMGQPPVSPV